MIRGARVLITGGTGSFGNQITRRLADMGPAEIRVFSRDEDKQYRMQAQVAEWPANFTFMLGDVRDPDAVRIAMRGIDIVFHAAALKHVPGCERDVWQAVRTNIEGARNTIEAALNEQVEALVAISTDKAVEPVNAMGMTKALQEKLVASSSRRPDVGRVRMCCVRYGNVLGSRGSVVPHFADRLGQGRRLTVTDPTMTRYVLTLDRAVDLVLAAVEQAEGGELFVRRSPSTTMGQLAEVMLRLWDRKVEFDIVGRRPGEKVHETLVSELESTRAYEQGDVVCLLPELPDRAYGVARNWTTLKHGPLTSENAKRLSDAELAGLLDANGWGPTRSARESESVANPAP